ncbi:unnamed protein product [Rotaria sordida]|uniref:MAM domain-containing protein n=1 Tax=Rotaria sordida TaxID=392033 RepID=A0A815ICH6_9BILA|nr:unnamed protein product [Rotaria sordida]CAF1364051.1 unnamed protein product [Rotaria sordida]
MLPILFILLCQTFLSQGTILNCDFETNCNDFALYGFWAITDGYHPQPIDHDHTLNIEAGHYVFYNPSPGTRGFEMRTQNWLQPSTDRPLCFRMWYYPSQINFLFSVQVVQGEGVELIRTLASVVDKNVSTVDWTLINVKLPNEKIKISVQTNLTQKYLAFDDISVDYCDGPRPSPPKVLFTCDFESPCSDNFVSLPKYPYQWLISNASDANRIEFFAPSADYTFGNGSGHYAFVPVSKIVDNGKVGYLHLQKQLQITSQESYCLNFQYYAYPSSDRSYLKIYSWASDESKAIQMLWPGERSSYSILGGRWAWGIINLPVGNYSLLFRVDTDTSFTYSFALDNIDITSCDYPPSSTSYNSLLSFSCNFDNSTMCDMINDEMSSTFNFTIFTGDTIPDQELGPDRDHTNNSTSGGFLYWNQYLPVNTSDRGRVYLSKKLSNMLNTTVIRLSGDGYSSTGLWYQVLDDSQGWQIALVPLRLGFRFHHRLYNDANNRLNHKLRSVTTVQSRLAMDIYNLYPAYGKDNYNVYFAGEKMNVGSVNSFEVLGNFYAKDKWNVYYMNKKLDIISIGSFHELGSGYAKDNYNVYFLDKKLDVISVSSFKTLGYRYAKDNYNVYYIGRKLDVISVSSFVALDNRYAKDNYNVYYLDKKLDVISVSSFKVLGNGYAKDNYNVYYLGKRLNVISVSSFEVLHGAYAKDNYNVYLAGEKLDVISISSFKVLSSDYAKDNYNVYYLNKKLDVISVNSFQALGHGYAKDNYNVYYLDKKLDVISVSSFKVLGGDYAKDNYNVYYIGRKLDVISVYSFEASSNGYAKDNYNVYYMGKKIPGASVSSFTLFKQK